MRLFARLLDVPPDPLAIARALSREPGFAFLWNAAADGTSTIACHPVEQSGDLDPEPSLRSDPELGPLGAAPRWIGLLPYESRRSLERPRWTRAPEDRPPPLSEDVVWRRYGAVVRVHRDVTVVGDDERLVRELSVLARREGPVEPVKIEPLPSEPDDAHEARIRRALDLILEGEIYQVNLARRFDFLVEARALPLLEHLSGKSRVPFGAAFDDGELRVAAASPELFLSLDPRGFLRTRPIKGTRPRGHDAAEDARLAADLERDPKEHAELSMVIDVERNDLGRIARTGSVRVVGRPRIETSETVHHRVADVVAWLAPGKTRRELLESMLPSGSVTGAPKVRAMELIARLESVRRGIYTGAFGALSHDGSLSLAMAIRTLVAKNGTGHYFAGGGIVHGSDPLREVEETRWKAARLLRQSWPSTRPPIIEASLNPWTR